VQIAVISDPHGDLVAVRAVVADLEGHSLDEVLDGLLRTRRGHSAAALIRRKG
jgi:hypothetical protein